MMSESEQPKLEIDFISFREFPTIDSYKFLSEKYEVKPNTSNIIQIPFSFFDEDETKCTSLKLYQNSILVNECIIEIFKGYNYCCCLLDEKGYMLHLLFNKNDNLEVKVPIYKNQYYKVDAEGKSVLVSQRPDVLMENPR